MGRRPNTSLKPTPEAMFVRCPTACARARLSLSLGFICDVPKGFICAIDMNARYSISSPKACIFISSSVIVLVMIVGGCNYFAVEFAPDKQAATLRSADAEQADTYFWEVLHRGGYEDIPEAMTRLKAVYLANPYDAVTAAHIGFLHLWRLAERNRLTVIPPGLTDDAVLARKYFGEAVRLDNKDARTAGFYAIMHMLEGDIHGDVKLSRQGYFLGSEAIRAWPSFNLFTVGYAMSTIAHTDPRFQEALEWQWETMEECFGRQVNRADPSIEQYLALEASEIDEQRRRACWNTWIAPHNLEGFFLNMGDMLVKSGQWEMGVKIYENAKRVKQYESWPFKGELEQRIHEANTNVERFRKQYLMGQVIKEPTLMINTSFSCVGCHEQ